MMRSIIIALALATTLLSVPANAQTNDLQPVAIEASQVKDIDPALWVVKDADTTIYLFGTVHILKPGLGWFDDGVKSAFDASDTLVIEMIEPTAAEQTAIMAELSIDKSGKTIRERLNADDRKAYEAALTQLSLPAEALDPLDGWAVALNLYYAGLMKNGYDLNSGVETQLKAAAKASKKTIIGLETMRGQLSIFDNLSPEIQLRYVGDTAKALDQIVPQTDQLVDLWATANPDGVASIMNEGFDSLNLTEPLLTRRNANWAQWIKGRMEKPGTVFMAVGAGHLAGPVSVQNLLLSYGLNSELVRY
jgi:uncharacterized protein